MITSLVINGFRGLSFHDDNLSRVNVLVGDSGVGKTSFLEAVYFASLFSSSKLSLEEIRWDVSHMIDSRSEPIYSFITMAGSSIKVDGYELNVKYEDPYTLNVYAPAFSHVGEERTGRIADLHLGMTSTFFRGFSIQALVLHMSCAEEVRNAFSRGDYVPVYLPVTFDRFRYPCKVILNPRLLGNFLLDEKPGESSSANDGSSNQENGSSQSSSSPSVSSSVSSSVSDPNAVDDHVDSVCSKSVVTYGSDVSFPVRGGDKGCPFCVLGRGALKEAMVRSALDYANVLLIDEVENSLNPDRLHEVLRSIVEAKNVQSFLVTYSDHVIKTLASLSRDDDVSVYYFVDDTKYRRYSLSQVAQYESPLSWMGYI